MSLIIGIDPGSRLTGYGIIEKDGSKLTFVDAGTIRTETKEMPERLKRIFAGVERIVKFYGPTEAAVEQVFMAQNPDSALKLGQARGAAVAALVTCNHPNTLPGGSCSAAFLVRSQIINIADGYAVEVPIPIKIRAIINMAKL